MTNQVQPAANNGTSIKLIPARIDFTTNLTQLMVANIVAFVAAIAMFAPTTNIMLPSDRRLMQTISAIVHQDNLGWVINPFAAAMHRQTTMHADRGPLAILSLMVDRHVLGLSDSALHWGNIVLEAACAVLVVQITALLVGSQKRSSALAAAAAVWAGILFVLFPNSADHLIDIGGRGDMLAQAFGLASIFLYLRFRMLREERLFRLSLLCFVLGMLSSTSAIIVPIAITLGELLFFADDKSRLMQRLMPVVLFWMALTFVGTLLIAIPGSKPLAFVDISRFGIEFGPPIVQPVYWCFAVGILLLSCWRIFAPGVYWRPILWCALWLLAGVAMHFGVEPFTLRRAAFELLPAAPACMLTALLCIPALDIKTRATARPLLLAGPAIAIVLAALFAYASILDLRFWQDRSNYHWIRRLEGR